MSLAHYAEELPGFAGKVMQAHFRLAGRDYYAFDAGPQFPFTEAISLFVSCADQDEVDKYWEALTATAARNSRAAGSRTAGVCRGRSCRIGSSS